MSALFSGLGLALNWTTLGYYVSLCGDENNRGRFHGIAFQYFTTGYLCALFFGGLVADHFGLFTLYCVIPMVTILAGVVALGLPIPEPTDDCVIREQELAQYTTEEDSPEMPEKPASIGTLEDDTTTEIESPKADMPEKDNSTRAYLSKSLNLFR